jgi:hypothetical protein
MTDEQRRQWRDNPEKFLVFSKSPTDEEEAVLEAAAELADAKAEFATEVARGMAAGARNSYEATTAVQASSFSRRVIMAEARYQIALARL